MKTYTVKEIFYTLQGEGANAGRPAVFCRFAGCNLWSGHEKDRATATCQFCDTNFVGGEKFIGPESLAEAALKKAPVAGTLLVCTGGEPLLQLDPPLLNAFKDRGFDIAVETNGTIKAPPGIDWLCVSPKVNAELVQISGDEIKLVFPQEGGEPAKYEKLDFKNFFLQPMDGPAIEENTKRAVEYCMAHPKWRLSLQTHKLLGIP